MNQSKRILERQNLPLLVVFVCSLLAPTGLNAQSISVCVCRTSETRAYCDNGTREITLLYACPSVQQAQVILTRDNESQIVAPPPADQTGTMASPIVSGNDQPSLLVVVAPEAPQQPAQPSGQQAPGSPGSPGFPESNGQPAIPSQQTSTSKQAAVTVAQNALHSPPKTGGGTGRSESGTTAAVPSAAPTLVGGPMIETAPVGGPGPASGQDSATGSSGVASSRSQGGGLGCNLVPLR